VLLAATASRSTVVAAGLVFLVAAAFGLVDPAASAVRSTASFGGDFSLSLRIHGGEATIASAGAAPRSIPRFVGLAPVIAGVFCVQIGTVVVPAGPVASRLAMMVGSGVVMKGSTFAVGGQPATTAGLGSFFRIPLVRVARLMSGATTFAGDAALFFGIHCSKSSIAIGHGYYPPESQVCSQLVFWECPRQLCKSKTRRAHQEED
jgi:hypothetical protein